MEAVARVAEAVEAAKEVVGKAVAKAPLDGPALIRISAPDPVVRMALARPR